MGLRINTNIASLNAQRNLSASNDETRKSLQRLSSGKRITNAGDDAAGLSVSSNLQAQTRGIRQADRYTNDGIAVVQTAEGGLNEVGNILFRLRELSVQAASDTLGDTERGFLDQEVQQLKEEVDRIAESTNFNGAHLLNGEIEDGELHFQVGAFADASNRIIYDADATNVRAEEIGIEDVALESRDEALDSMEVIDDAIENVNSMRANLGAIQNRLQSTVRSLRVADENMSDAYSRIADTDVALESANLVKNQILQQAGIATLASANTAPQSALKLI
jgi:flagellin